MATLYIMRGIPGSGKSYTSRELAGEEGVVCSTDDFFMEDGQYNFNPSSLGKAHAWNYNRAVDAINKGKDPVVIDNTNTSAWEPKKYVHVAKECGYEVVIVEPTSSWWKEFRPLLKSKGPGSEIQKWAEFFANKNEHGVPVDAIKRMIQRWKYDLTVEDILAAKGK